MTRDKIIAMARKAGFFVVLDPSTMLRPDEFDGRVFVEEYPIGDALQKFAYLVAAHEREESAKVCEAEDVAGSDFAPGVQECIAAAIRARKEKT